MSNASIRKCELITRSIARWGSVVAAIMFGIAFLTDKSLSYAIVSGQAFADRASLGGIYWISAGLEEKA